MDGKKSPTIKPMVSRAPTPISPVGGSSWRLPELIKQPRKLPTDYPDTLSLRTLAVINEVREKEKFPRRSQLLDFCKEVLANLTPTFCTEVKAARLQGPQALSHLDGLLDSLLLSNEYSEPILADLGQELKRSKERAIFIHELLRAEEQARRSPQSSRKAEATEAAVVADSGRPRSQPVESTVPKSAKQAREPKKFQIGKEVHSLVPHCVEGLILLRKAKTEHHAAEHIWKSELLQKGFSEKEFEILTRSRKPESVACQMVAQKHPEMELKTVRNHYSAFKHS